MNAKENPNTKDTPTEMLSRRTVIKSMAAKRPAVQMDAVKAFAGWRGLMDIAVWYPVGQQIPARTIKKANHIAAVNDTRTLKQETRRQVGLPDPQPATNNAKGIADTNPHRMTSEMESRTYRRLTGSAAFQTPADTLRPRKVAENALEEPSFRPMFMVPQCINYIVSPTESRNNPVRIACSISILLFRKLIRWIC
jgi:hypothetical protein